MTLAQRRVAASLAFCASAALAGLALVPDGVEYRAFGMVEGVFALLLAYLLVMRGAWAPAEGMLGWIAVAYGTLASAQVLELLFPPPGMIEWMVTAGVAVTAWGAFAGGTRRRLVFALASLALLLAVLKFSVIPVLWTRVGPAAGTGFGLGDAAEGVRRVFADYRPLRPAGQMVGFAAIAFWAIATRLVWPQAAPGEEDSRTGVRQEF
ncbi:MAG TPA: hypothetical protein VF665_00235 [Longimicrobium sp.]|jgi:hypothetical protein|uniref:hypothetical protein n=1 Tax=Longimicrobium sp. TaxID=2029185 RepID=UPI002EDB076F